MKAFEISISGGRATDRRGKGKGGREESHLGIKAVATQRKKDVCVVVEERERERNGKLTFLPLSVVSFRGNYFRIPFSPEFLSFPSSS